MVPGDGELLQEVYTWSCSDPLTDGLHGDPKDFSWSPQMDYAFVSAKSAFALVPTLEHPYLSARVSLAVDASDSQVGAVFQQLVWGSLAPLAFYSKKLSSAKTCYSAFDRELLAAFSTVKHFRFRFLLEGWKFTLFTDHKPPTFSLFRVSPP